MRHWLNFLSFTVSALPAAATISLTLSDGSNSLSQLTESGGGSGTNGLLWGILIDTQGEGFGPVIHEINQTILLEDGQELAPGCFFFVGGTTLTGPEGPGTVTTAAAVPAFDSPGVSAGQSFAIIWFDSGIPAGGALVGGMRFGILADPGLLLPSDGTDVTFSHLFPGPDPVRPAEQTVLPQIPASTTTEIIELDPGGGEPLTCNMAFTFPVSVAADDSGLLSYALEQSTSLEETSWMPASSVTTILSEVDGLRTLRIIDPEPVGDVPRRFLRLRVSTP